MENTGASPEDRRSPGVPADGTYYALRDGQVVPA